jgi:hypothetical protein
MITLADEGSGVDFAFVRELTWDTTKDILLGNDISTGPAMWMFVGALAAFLVTRGVTRLIRHRSNAGAESTGPVKDITIGGVHIHHQVFGITLMFLMGLLFVAAQPTGAWLDTLAALFGVGVGLAFDEFALWVHLDDVYWAEQGRKSIDAVALILVITACAPTLVVLVEVTADAPNLGELWWLPVYLAVLYFVPAGLCLLKGKAITAAAGIIYPPIGIVGAIRLAKPGSLWARWFYSRRPRAQDRSQRRFGERYAARLDRMRDLVAGAVTSLEHATSRDDAPSD